MNTTISTRPASVILARDLDRQRRRRRLAHKQAERTRRGHKHAGGAR